MPNEHHPQPGADFSCLSAAAQLMIQAHQRLQLAQQATRLAANDLDLTQDHFIEQLAASGQQDGCEHLLFKSREGEFWVIRVDVEDGFVVSITPAVEVE